MKATESQWWQSKWTLQMISIGGSHEWSDERDGQLDAVRPNSQDVNISFYLRPRSYIAVEWREDSKAQMGGLEVI